MKCKHEFIEIRSGGSDVYSVTACKKCNTMTSGYPYKGGFPNEKKLLIQKIWCQAKQYKVMPKNFINFLEKLWLDGVKDELTLLGPGGDNYISYPHVRKMYGRCTARSK